MGDDFKYHELLDAADEALTVAASLFNRGDITGYRGALAAAQRLVRQANQTRGETS